MKLRFIISVFFSLVSCSDIDVSRINDADRSSVPWLYALPTNLTSLTWKITLFSNSRVDNTETFDGYIFDFQEESAIIVQTGENIYEGNWLIIDKSDYPGYSRNISDMYLFIEFELDDSIEDINGEWNITSFSFTKMEMERINENGTTDYLNFEQNL